MTESNTPPYQIVDPPVVLPYSFGLLNTATVITGDDLWESGGVQYQTDYCGGGQPVDAHGDPLPDPGLPPWCPAPDPVAQLNVAEGITSVYGDAFTIYAGLRCRPVGIGDAQARAQRRLGILEPLLVERHYYTSQLAAPLEASAIVNPDSAWPPADPGSNTPIAAPAAIPDDQGVGLLEQALAERYGGIGVLHGQRQVAASLAHGQIIVRSGPNLAGPLGTPWVFGAGYGNTATVQYVKPDGTPGSTCPVTTPAGTVWLYATGVVTVRRGTPYLVPAQLGDGLDKTTNWLTVYAQRPYVITHDCFRAAALVQLPSQSS